jgi:glycosyltransferase involved in cell wall biosynthesis
MKVAFISSMLPSGHYSQYLTGGLNAVPGMDLVVYADKNRANVEIQGCGRIKTVWSRSIAFIPQIILEAQRDKPDIIHLQHELNMYGGIATAALFPLLILLLKLFGHRVVVTVHAAVYRKQIDREFIALFHRDSAVFHPVFLTAFFSYVFKAISMLSDRVIVHTNLKKDILTTDYGVDPTQIEVIPIAIPSKIIDNTSKEPYFLYFGYMVRRKGLDYALEGFRRFIDANPGTSHTLVLAGGVIKGQEAAFREITDMIEANGLTGKIVMRGFVEESELDDLYWNAEAVIIPAKISMGSSGPLFHAASYGKCVIASRVGHFEEDIKHLETGVLVDNDRWHEAFQFLADHPRIVSQIERNIAQKAASWTPAIVAGRHMSVYRSVAG